MLWDGTRKSYRNILSHVAKLQSVANSDSDGTALSKQKWSWPLRKEVAVAFYYLDRQGHGLFKVCASLKPYKGKSARD